MSEAQTRPSSSATRGRGSSKSGRGGLVRSGHGAARNTTNGDAQHDGIEEQSVVGQLKKRYSSQLAVLKEMFPNDTEEDILFELQENNGDLQATADKISEGATAQWGEVKKKGKDRSRSKAQESAFATSNNNDSFQSSRPARGGRTLGGGRGGYEPRGGHGGRGGRGGRGRGGSIANGVSRHQAKRSSSDVPFSWGEPSFTAPAPSADGAWDAKPDDDFKEEGGWGTPDAAAPAPEKPVTKVSPVVPAGGSWASLLKPAVSLPAPKPVPQQPAQPIPEKEPPPPKEPEPAVELPKEPDLPPAPVEEPVLQEDQAPEPEVEVEPATEPEALEEHIQAEEPMAQQELTEDSAEKLGDTAAPAPTGTQASTVATSLAAVSVSITPQPPIATPPVSAKYTPVPKGTPGRTFRRVLDQQEGVVMPGNHAEVNRTALQFGSMGLSGDTDDDDEIEQAETVLQLQPSPIPQPVASLPPTGPSQLPVSQPPIAPIEAVPTPRQAPGLPSHQVALQQPSPQPPLGPQSMMQHQPQLQQQYSRYGVPEQQPQTKQFDTFAHMQHSAPQQPPAQPQTQHPQTQHPQTQPNYAQYMHPQQPSHLALGVSSAQEQPNYNYYTDSRSQPPGFGLYGNSAYMQAQQAHAQQEAGANQQRASSGLGGAVDSTGQVPTSAAGPGQVQQPNSRYGVPAGDQNSGHATPSPAPVQTTQQHQQSMGQYPMQFHPYYNQYMHQNYYPQPSPFGKNMYAYPQYMPSQQYPDHTSSPAGLGGFAAPSAQGRESMMADYGRMNTSAAQQSLPQHSTSGSYGNGIPNFLGSRGLPQDQQQLGAVSVGQQQAGQSAQGDDMKFGESKPPTGPSSAPLQGQPGRPGSATSGAAGLGTQQGVPNPAMYGSHLNPSLHGAHQGQQQQSGYGAAQGQSANHYSMYSGAYPGQYTPGSGRHTAGSGSGWSYSH